MKTLLMSTVAALFTFGAANADEMVVIVDTDTDGVITMEEFEAAFAEPREEFWFDAWDTERTGVLTREDVLSRSWAQYDIDGDNVLSQEEVRAWNEDNIRLNAMRSGREISDPGGGAEGGAATQ